MKENILNLTPHALNIHDEQGNHVLTVPPSGAVARCKVARKKSGSIEGVPLFVTELGEVEGLPDENGDCAIVVVSGLVRSALPDRLDLWQPGELLRNEQGRVIGCIGLSR